MQNIGADDWALEGWTVLYFAMARCSLQNKDKSRSEGGGMIPDLEPFDV